MRTLRWEFYNVKADDAWTLYPLGDIHLGAATCDEKLLAHDIQAIADDPRGLWVGMGDMCDWINQSDPRFNVGCLADWLVNKHSLADLAGAERERFVQMVEPIAGKCIGLLAGNHETAIQKHYERAIYNEIVTNVKTTGGFEPDRALALGYHGWLQLAFYHGPDKKGGSHVLRVSLHHGFTGGRLAGGKALAMQRWLWSHDADLVLMGHSHNIDTDVAAVYGIDKAGHHVEYVRKGAFTGTYLRSVSDQGTDTYAEVKGYMPAAVGGIQVLLHPMAKYQPQRVRIVA